MIYSGAARLSCSSWQLSLCLIISYVGGFCPVAASVGDSHAALRPLRYGAERFPYLLESDSNDIVILEDLLTPESCSGLSALVSREITERGHTKETANHATLFTEEILLTVLEKNRKRKRRLQAEITLLFDRDSVQLIERDNGEIFDDTDQDMKVDGFSSYVLSRLMVVHQEKMYLTTTGYNRTMLQFNDPVSE